MSIELFLKTCSFSLFNTKRQHFPCIKMHICALEQLGWIQFSNLNLDRCKQPSREGRRPKHKDLHFADENITHTWSYRRRSLFPLEAAGVCDYEIGGLSISSWGLCTGKRAWADRRWSPYEVYKRGALNLARNRRKISCGQG